MFNVAKLDNDLLGAVKRGFVEMPGGQQGPVAGGGMLTQAQAAPMDPAAMGGGAPPMDPSMGGGAPPMDPAAMGGDPAAMGGDPAAMGMDPAMMGMDPAAMMGGAPEGAAAGVDESGKPLITISVEDLKDLVTTLVAAAGGAAAPVKKAKPEGGGGADSPLLQAIAKQLGVQSPAEPAV